MSACFIFWLAESFDVTSSCYVPVTCFVLWSVPRLPCGYHAPSMHLSYVCHMSSTVSHEIYHAFILRISCWLAGLCQVQLFLQNMPLSHVSCFHVMHLLNVSGFVRCGLLSMNIWSHFALNILHFSFKFDFCWRQLGADRSLKFAPCWGDWGELLPKERYGNSLSGRGSNTQLSDREVDTLPLSHCCPTYLTFVSLEFLLNHSSSSSNFCLLEYEKLELRIRSSSFSIVSLLSVVLFSISLCWENCWSKWDLTVEHSWRVSTSSFPDLRKLINAFLFSPCHDNVRVGPRK